MKRCVWIVALALAGAGLAGCKDDEITNLTIGEPAITISGPWSGSSSPVLTAGSPDAVFTLADQAIGPLSAGFNCSAGAVTWSFVDAHTHQRGSAPSLNPALAELGTDSIGNPLGCATSADPSQAPRAFLPHIFDDGRPHTLTVYAELSVTGLREVDDGFGDHKYGVVAVADGQVTVRVAPPGGAAPPLSASPSPPSPPPPAPATVSFEIPVTYPMAEHAAGLAVDDLHLNGAGRADGKADVAVAETPDSANIPGRLEVWRAAQDGSLSAWGGPYQFPAGVIPAQAVSADLNGDGAPDLAIAESGASAVGVLRNLTDGSFDVPGAVNLVGSHPEAVAAGPLCGSRADDLVAANFFTNDLTVLCNDGKGMFQGGGGHFFPSGGVQPSAVAVADLNGDGQGDVIVASGDTSGSVAVLRGTTATNPPMFAAPQYVSSYSAAGPTGVAVGDLTGDGLPDIVAADPGADRVVVLINRTRPGATAFSFDVSYAGVAGSRPCAVALGDFNGDGNLDIATADAGSADASVLAGEGGGFFLPAVAVSAGVNPHAVAAGDVNGDGNDDLIVASYGANTGSLTVALSAPPAPSAARDRSRRHGRALRRMLRANVGLHASRPRKVTFSHDGMTLSFSGQPAGRRSVSAVISSAPPRGMSRECRALVGALPRR